VDTDRGSGTNAAVELPLRLAVAVRFTLNDCSGELPLIAFGYHDYHPCRGRDIADAHLHRAFVETPNRDFAFTEGLSASIDLMMDAAVQ
jgi:hypothetical protein